MIEIRRISNGAVVKYEDDDGSFEIAYASEGLSWLVAMLLDINERMEPTSKHDAERVQIKLVHGSDYICGSKNCKICSKKN